MEEHNYTVYMHLFPNNKKYIGITKVKPHYRWGSNGRYHHNVYMMNAIKKYKWENVKHIILYTNLTKEEAEQKEIELISYYKSNQRKYGYNIQNGGNVHCVSEETKRKISNSTKGEKHFMYGTHRSKETINKMSKSMKGRKGYWKGKHRTEETKIKISNALKGKKSHNALKVLCVETGIIYDNMHIASEKTNTYISGICNCCKGKLKTTNGFHWKYYNEEKKEGEDK